MKTCEYLYNTQLDAQCAGLPWKIILTEQRAIEDGALSAQIAYQPYGSSTRPFVGPYNRRVN